jgi:UDP-glucose 4-epimerase
MKILVTGGAGFIGSQVADAYLAAGHDVFIVDDLSTGLKKNVHRQAKFVNMDIRDKRLKGLLKKERFDAVNHHAAQINVRKSLDDPTFDASVNILGTLNLLESSVASGVTKIIFASTGGAIYGEQEYFPADEAHPTRPASPYGIAKLAVEKYLFYYRTVHGLNHVVLRYANVYGPRQNPHGEAGVVAIFCTRLLKKAETIINGDGKQTRDYVFVDDVVRANVLSLGMNDSDVFNIGTGIETDVNELFTSIKSMTSSKSQEHHGPQKLGEQRRSVLDARKAQQILGWRPLVNLDDGLRRTVEFFSQKR